MAYDLNNFYLYKRYSDHASALVGSPVEYNYWKQGATELELKSGKYYNNEDAKECSSGAGCKYVEDRFADGDFRYAAGTIPEEDDERQYVDPEDDTKVSFYPIWPDDYIFFGQKLTYGWAPQAHQKVPTAVVRDGGRLSLASNANRVYRAPAYYRNSVMDVAHFNPDAYLAGKSKDGLKEAHPNMTAIDFAGHEEGHAASAYKKGFNGKWFYQPLLDDDGLTSITNCDETQNLLVYAPAAVPASEGAYANAMTHGVLTSYFVDPVYDDYYHNSDGYRLVTESTAAIYGHLVQNDFTAVNDHLLVDKQDFNAPFAYTFDATHRMWYQRKPADKEFVDRSTGWQGVSLPFTAELVTTNTKGEITHFYSGSSESDNGTGTKKGHEYWLRELGITMTEKSTGVLEADFHYPTAAGDAKTVTNSFLWDYYYMNEDVHNQLDENADTLLQYRQYYKDARTYSSYPLLTAAKPYILGLPGQTYYEFDLSGKFQAQNTAATLAKIGKQTITFASNTGEHIGVSDSEMDGGTTANYESKNYTFKPSYMNRTTLDGNAYVLNGTGDAYETHTTHGAHGVSEPCVTAFRPYFLAEAGGSVKRQLPTRSSFSGDNGEEFEEGPESALDGSIEIFARGRNIITRSHMAEPTTVRIVNIGGITITNFVLQPGQTIETPVQDHGAYIVNKKKIFIK